MAVPFIENALLNRLARRMRRGDERAAEDIYRRLVGKVYGFCMNRVRHKELAEDLTQEIFLKLVAKIATFDDRKGNFLGWFWQLARNTMIDHFRSREAKVETFSSFSESEVESFRSEDGRERAAQQFDISYLRAFLTSLSAEEQELFELRFVAELPYAEIAKVVGKQEGNLRVAISRLRSKIRLHAREKGIIG